MLSLDDLEFDHGLRIVFDDGVELRIQTWRDNGTIEVTYSLKDQWEKTLYFTPEEFKAATKAHYTFLTKVFGGYVSHNM
jgi:hypothetical protein